MPSADKWKIVLNTKQLERKNKRIVRELNKAANSTVIELGNYGMWYAKSIAPKRTGKTSDMIITRHEGLRSKIIAKNPTYSRSPPFSLVRWMHESPAAQAFIKTGTADFMEVMKNELNRIKPGVAERTVERVNLNKL